jgi:hypothetical protein
MPGMPIGRLISSQAFGQNERMNTLHPTPKGWFVLLLACTFTTPFTTASVGAEGQPGTAIVRGILGYAQVARVSGQFSPLGPGMTLRTGDLVQTASNSALDLDFGNAVGTVRLAESGVLALDKLSGTGPKAGANYEVQLDLRKGELLGLIERVRGDSRFEVKVSKGIGHMSEGRFRIDAQGRVVVVQGKVLFAHVPLTGDPAAHTLTAPPASYFSPEEGVRPAPKELIREVTNQMRSKLPRR